MLFRVRSILVATDRSKRAAEVIRGAAALAELAEAELHVVTAVDTTRVEDVAAEEATDTATTAIRKILRGSLPPSLEAASCRVVIGEPHEVILQRARELAVDLVVIGPHREERERRDSLGTTADRLIRTSDAPCLVLRAPLALPLRNLLVSSDLSAAAGGAVNLAMVWAGALRLPSSTGQRTQVRVVHVTPSAGNDRAAAESDEEGRELREQVEEAVRISGIRSLVEIEPEAVRGEEVADEILRHARDPHADLLVMGTHGQSSGARELIGRVSSIVARRAPCPVLLVPPTFWKAFLARETSVQSEPR